MFVIQDGVGVIGYLAGRMPLAEGHQVFRAVKPLPSLTDAELSAARNISVEYMDFHKFGNDLMVGASTAAILTRQSVTRLSGALTFYRTRRVTPTLDARSALIYLDGDDRICTREFGGEEVIEDPISAPTSIMQRFMRYVVQRKQEECNLPST